MKQNTFVTMVDPLGRQSRVTIGSFEKVWSQRGFTLVERDVPEAEEFADEIVEDVPGGSDPATDLGTTEGQGEKSEEAPAPRLGRRTGGTGLADSNSTSQTPAKE